MLSFKSAVLGFGLVLVMGVAAHAQSLPGSESGGASGELARSARSGRRGLFNGKDDYLLPDQSGEAIYRGYGVRDHSPLAEGVPGQGFCMRAEH